MSGIAVAGTRSRVTARAGVLGAAAESATTTAAAAAIAAEIEIAATGEKGNPLEKARAGAGAAAVVVVVIRPAVRRHLLSKAAGQSMRRSAVVGRAGAAPGKGKRETRKTAIDCQLLLVVPCPGRERRAAAFATAVKMERTMAGWFTASEAHPHPRPHPRDPKNLLRMGSSSRNHRARKTTILDLLFLCTSFPLYREVFI